MLPGRGPGSRPGDTWAGRLARPPREGWQFAIRRPSPRSHASRTEPPSQTADLGHLARGGG